MENKYEETIKSQHKLDTKDFVFNYSKMCKEIIKDIQSAEQFTNKGNSIAIISDGSAVLGLGNIGVNATLPVLEGKAVLLKQFANINAIPLCIDIHEESQIVEIIKALACNVSGILIEGIEDSKCVLIERWLKEELNIPVFHDDQHGGAIIILAAIINYLRLSKKSKDEVRIVVSCTNTEGSSIIKLLHDYGILNIEGFDLKGQIRLRDKWKYNALKREVSTYVNFDKKEYDNISDAMINADIFVGVNAPDRVTTEMVSSMKERPAVFVITNPTVDRILEEALRGSVVLATSIHDKPNQLSNILVTLGFLRGALDGKATKITEGMKIAASSAIAELVRDDELDENYIIPSIFDSRVCDSIALAVKNHIMNRDDIDVSP